jgi:ribosomal-protein-alanine N-acetyltransferase
MKHIPETERLYMREFSLDDVATLYEMHQDPEIIRYTGDPLPWDSLEQTEKVLREILMPQYEKKIGRWAVHLKSDDTFIGWCGLKDIGDEIDLGYRYIQKYWGNGYASEAAKAVLEYGVQIGLPNIVGRADAKNKASVKILGKIGLTFKETYLDNGSESVKYIWK